MSDIADTLESMPPWVIPAAAVGVVLLALMSSRSSGAAAGGYGAVGVLEPRPADANLVALAQSEVGAKVTAFQSVVAAMSGEKLAQYHNEHDIAISHIAADRDVELGSIQANVANVRTQSSLALGMEQARTAAQIVKTQGDNALALSRDQGATAKYQAKQQTKQSIAGTVGSVIKTGLGFIAKLF